MLKEIIAAGELSRYVESYWEADGALTFALPPDGTYNIVITTAPLRLAANGPLSLGAGGYLLPLHTQTLQLQGQGRIMGIRLKAFVQLPQSMQRSAPTPHSTVVTLSGNPAFQHGRSQWQADMSLADYVPSMEAMLMGLLGDAPRWSPHLRDKVNYVLDRKGLVRMEAMEKAFGVSRQALHKEFVKGIGISPKQLAGIWQFNHFLDQLDATELLTHSALDAGYYDQSHGIHHCVKMLGFPPRQCLHAAPPWLDFLRSCIHRRFTNGYDPT